MNKNIEYLENFNSLVAKCLKSYLCKYIALISNHYKQCHQSLQQNIETFKCIQKCVKSMLTQLNSTRSEESSNGKDGPKEFVKSVFKYISYSGNINDTFDYMKNNYPSQTINRINAYLHNIGQFFDGTNDIGITINVLTTFKKYLSWFSNHIDNYITIITWYLILPLSRLTIADDTISMIQELGTSVPRIKEIREKLKKYEFIKHKVNWCKSSLEFEVQRLNSILSNSKMLENHLESLIEILNKYKENLDKLSTFKLRLQTLKQKKSNSILQLKVYVKWAISNLCKIKCISQGLESRKSSVSIMTIKQDIEYIKSEIEAININVSYVQSTLLSLRDVKFDVNCQTVNQIEWSIKEIVCLIHKKYCCLTSIITNINIGEECKKFSAESLKEICDISNISECTTTPPSPPSPDSCKVCGTTQENHQCECCVKICECLEQLKSQATSSGSKIDENLECIREIINKLTTTQQGQITVTCPSSGQPVTCQTPPSIACPTSQQAQTTTECTSQAENIKKVIQCVSEQITKWKSTPLSCVTTEGAQCTVPQETTCQSNTQGSSTTACSTSGQPSNPCKLGQVKLFLDTMINKCCCQQLKDFLDKNNNIEKGINMFKLVIIFNFVELFCLYLGFDKWMVEYFSSCMNKLGDIKLYMRGIGCIQNEINSRIGYIKYEINQMPEEIRILENHMKLAITEMECEIEEVPRNMIRCSLKSLSNWIKNWYNSNQGLTKIIC